MTQRQSNLWAIVLSIGIVVSLVLVYSAFDSGASQSRSSGVVPSSIPVAYYMVSDHAVEVSYVNGTNGMNNEHVGSYWEKTVALPIGSMAYVTGQNQYDGSVMVKIVCGGREVKRSQSNGRYAIATASAICP
jgi:hypothetical protein